MSDDITSIMLAFLVVLGPIWVILHYVSKMRGNRALNALDAAAFTQLSQTAARMEQRMATLERILDAQAPDWRVAEAMGVRNGTI